MKLMKKRLMSLLLVLALVLSLVAPAMAEELPDQAGESTPAAVQVEENAEEEKEENQEKEEKQEKEEEKEEEEQQDEQGDEAQDAPAQEAEESSTDAFSTEESASSDGAVDTPQAGSEPLEELASQPSDTEAPQTPAAALETEALSLTVGQEGQIKLLNAEAASYQSSDANTAAVDSQGKVTALRVGIALVEVKDTAGKSYICTVTVEPTITRTEATMTVGKSTTLTLQDRELAQIESSDPSLVSVDEQGNASALQAGTVEVTLTDTLGDLHVCTIKVKAVLSETSLNLSETNTAQLSFRGSPIVQARSSNGAVASVDATGVVTGVKAGSAVLTLTDASGNEANCKVTVKINYLARSAASAKKVYGKIVSLHCRHSGGTRSYGQLLKRKKITCGTGVSVALQGAGLLKKGDVITHTSKGSTKRKLRKTSNAIKNLGRLKKGTYTIYKAGCKYSKLPAKYKAAGMVYVQDSNICISAGGGYIYTTNESSRQYRHGHYFKTRLNQGYTHSHVILYVIAPNS